MTHFDLSKLNVDLNRLVPTRADMDTLVSAFKDTVRSSAETRDPELIHSLSSGMGEIRLRGVCRRLSNSERAEMVELLLPDVKNESSPTQELIQRLLDTAPNLIALHDTMDSVGFERFNDGPARKWFGERAALAQAVDELKGFAFLVDVERDPEQADEAIERIEEVLRHNIDVFEGDERTQCLPAAFNARLLLDAFTEQRWGIEDPVDFARAWNERIKIHTTTGLGVYDTHDLRLSSDELRDIRKGLEKFPAYVLTLENVVLRMDFGQPPTGREGALGGYALGQIHLFDAVRGARPGVDYPEGSANAITYATVHEIAHAAQTVGMMDFQKLSGWIRVNNLTFRDPQTNRMHRMAENSMVPGEVVETDSGRYVVSLYGEPETFDFPMGITIDNPYNASQCGYLHREDARFVNYYASTTPEEDYAETLTTFLLTPETLKELAPEKYEFMDFLYGKLSRT
jgi:hypothetical protein